MTGFALTIWVYEQPGTAISVATLALFGFVPAIIISLIIGVYLDRFDCSSHDYQDLPQR